ncbi:hypothetical protein EMCRGX_G027365 [Ephydatia muelleri]
MEMSNAEESAIEEDDQDQEEQDVPMSAAAAESIAKDAASTLEKAKANLADAESRLERAEMKRNKEVIEECDELVSISRKAVISALNTQIAAQDALTKILTSTSAAKGFREINRAQRVDEAFTGMLDFYIGLR